MAALMGWDKELIESLERAKLLPPRTLRVIIDIRHDDAVKIYYECFGDERVLELSFPKVFSEARFVRARDIDHGQEAPTTESRR